MIQDRRNFLKRVSQAAAAWPLISGCAPSRARSGSLLTIEAPITRWDEAIPLGNGLMGGLLWGENELLKLSLDRGDLWDLRTPAMIQRKDWTWATIRKLVAEKNQAELVRMFDDPYNKIPYPTKIPAGRLEITLDGGRRAQSFNLDLRTGVGTAALSGASVQAFFSAAEPVAVIRIRGSSVQWRILPPAAVARLDYPAAREGSQGELKWYLQPAAAGLAYSVVAGSRISGGATEIALAITSTKDAADPVAEGRVRVAKALDAGYQRMLEPHTAWWRGFWEQSSVQVPEPAVQLHYEEAQYFYGAASRRGSPPMPLQGVWTADEGRLPPWHGDYHHDLNTQLPYWAYLAAGHFEEGLAFIDFMWNLLPEHRRFARSFYGAPGAAVPGVMTLDGKPMGGWGQYSLSPTAGAWVAQSFHWHWRYTMDRTFLAERAYPYCLAIAECLEALLKPGADGKLKLPLSTSPEIYDNTLRAWLTPNSNHDLTLLRWLFGVLAEMAPEAGRGGDAARWNGVLGRLDDLAVEGSNGPLRLSPDESLAESHRHHAHLMAVHPMGLLHIEGSDRDRAVIQASFRQLDELGAGAWRGYSFAWLAAMAARAGEPERALGNLRIYLDGFITRNGFHVNGDFKGKGYVKERMRPFTIEGNFAAAQTVHEMLLQSWGGVVRVFPAVPNEWADVSFDNLRAEGGFGVSARRRRGRTVSVSVKANVDGRLLLRDPFGDAKANWNLSGVSRKDSNYECVLVRGQTLEGRPA